MSRLRVVVLIVLALTAAGCLSHTTERELGRDFNDSWNNFETFVDGANNQAP